MAAPVPESIRVIGTHIPNPLIPMPIITSGGITRRGTIVDRTSFTRDSIGFIAVFLLYRIYGRDVGTRITVETTHRTGRIAELANPGLDFPPTSLNPLIYGTRGQHRPASDRLVLP